MHRDREEATGVDRDLRILDQVAAELVAPAFLALGSLYLTVALVGPWLGRPEEYAGEQQVAHGIAALVLLVCWRVQAHQGVSERAAHPWLLCLVALVSLVNARELWILGDPSHGVYMTLAAFAAGYGFLRPGWFMGALAVLATAWLAPLALLWPLEGAWSEWTVRFGTGLLASVAVFVTRRNSVMRQNALRRRAEEREQAAAQALREATAANEQRLAMQQAMQAAQRRESLGLMAGGIAHDFNNLLTAIGGNLELATHETDLPASVGATLEDARAATEHASRLTHQLLAYAGQAEPEVARIDLGTRVREVARVLRSSLPTGVQIRERGTPHALTVEADGAQLDQVLINLVQNAVDACRSGGGTIDVDWGIEPVNDGALQAMRFGSAHAPGDYAYLEVRDNGPGMDDVIQGQIFEPFFSTKQGGSGLGLAAVEGIAERHHAALAVSTAPGRGTRVRFLLPYTPGLAEAPATATRAIPSATGTVLLVDDEPSVRRVARRLLERAGFRVLEASSGRIALELASSEPVIDAALLDLTMPEQNGCEVAEALRQRTPTLPIVLMSGFDRDDVMARRDIPADYRFVSKPFSAADLVEAVRSAAGPVGSPRAAAFRARSPAFRGADI
ncbi:MAG: response regulator [Myxococcota bacterium]